jgi:hypothetical protein
MNVIHQINEAGFTIERFKVPPEYSELGVILPPLAH